MTTQIEAAARRWHDAGLCVIPIRADGSKAPDVSAWKQFQERRPTPEEITGWWGNGTARGIAVVWGAISGNGEALDFDALGLCDDFAALCHEHGHGELLDSLPLIETPSGGRHLLYRCEAPVPGNQKLAQTLADAEEGAPGARLVNARWVKIETLIETRGEGGYTLAPGSPLACHADGRPYRFLRGRPATIPTITAEERSILIALASTFNEYVEPERIVEPPPSRRDAFAGGLRPGDDYNARGDYESLLEQDRWRRLRCAGDKGLWQRPGKQGRGISATSNYAGSGLFYVFSSNAAPFAPQKAYSPFAVYAYLEHGGDFTEAARELGRQGYGEAPPQPLRLGRKSDTAAVDALPPSLLTEPEWPHADPLMFHGLAGDVVRAIEPHTEADPVALLVQFLTAFGSCIGRRAHFTAEADQHFGNLFVVLVGISAKGRKGTSWGHVLRLFAAAEPRWGLSCVQSGLSSGEGLIWHVRDPIEKQVKNKKTGQLETVTEDAGIDDKRLLVQEAEFASVLRVAGRDGSTLSAIVRDAWDRGRLQTMTKNNAARATGAHVSIVGHVTADELRRELSTTEAGNGFANRFLWLCVRRSKELPEGGRLDESDLSPLRVRLAGAIEGAQAKDCLKRDEAARGLWREVYHDLSEGGPGLSGAVTSRGEAQAMRLALLYALLDGDSCIRPAHLTAALALWEYVEASARYVFGDSLGDHVADDILRSLRANPAGLSRNDLRELFGRNQSSGRIGQALALLARHHRARVVTETDTGGRPAERWHAVRAGEPGESE